MTNDDPARARLRSLSISARRLLDYVAAQDGKARYAVLRHLARSPEPDMIADLRETVEAGMVAAVPGEPNTYDITDETVRALVLSEIGEQRLAKLRARADRARQRGGDEQRST